MKTCFDAVSAELKDIPVGEVFSKVFGESQYVRLVRLDTILDDGQLLAVTIGPHFSNDPLPVFQRIEPDEIVVWEKSIEIFPKTFQGTKEIPPKASFDFRVGNICFPEPNKILLKAKRNDGATIVNLASGSIPSSHQFRTAPMYEHYVLTAKDPTGDRQIIFDSSALAKKVATTSI